MWCLLHRFLRPSLTQMRRYPVARHPRHRAASTELCFRYLARRCRNKALILLCSCLGITNNSVDIHKWENPHVSLRVILEPLKSAWLASISSASSTGCPVKSILLTVIGLLISMYEGKDHKVLAVNSHAFLLHLPNREK